MELQLPHLSQSIIFRGATTAMTMAWNEGLRTKDDERSPKRKDTRNGLRWHSRRGRPTTSGLNPRTTLLKGFNIGGDDRDDACATTSMTAAMPTSIAVDVNQSVNESERTN